ncbi:magnesium chelatase subunit H [Nonomuraea maritima]|uniref:magnesium chelatase subunit H n=1 Tax=Nonomuraea maritima TaxID=683260 RepID=UPI00371CD0AF
MTPITIVTIGFEGHSALPLHDGFARYAGAVPVDRRAFTRDLLTTDEGRAEIAAALSGADALLVSGVHDPVEASALCEIAAGPKAVVPVMPNTADVLGLARLGDFDAGSPRAEAAYRLVAAAAPDPLPPHAATVLGALGRLGPLVPEEAGDLRRLAQIVSSFHQLTAENVAVGVAALVHVLRPDAQDDPGWPEPVRQHGFWHPDTGVVETWTPTTTKPGAGRVLLTCYPTQVTSGNDAHLRALVAALEQHGLDVVGWLGTLDQDGDLQAVTRVPDIDVCVNATGFTLSGAHGQPNVAFDVRFLAERDTPHFAVVPLFHQSVQQWRESPVGLAPRSVAMQIAIPELEGGVLSLVHAGRDEDGDALTGVKEHIRRIAETVARTVALSRMPAADKRVAFVVFSYPPDRGSVGSAAHLDVWASLHRTLLRLRDSGYTVDVPDTPEDLLGLAVTSDGGGVRSATAIADHYPAARYHRAAREEVERVSRFWGPPPGELDTDGVSIGIRGVRLGNVFIGVQPSHGYEGDPMALLFTPDASPSHSFTAFYTWLHHEFDPHALVHVGTHGALEFMPGAQAGLKPEDWPSLLVGTVPHFYLYCINNPSEGTIAKRRSNATLVSYLTPPLDNAGLYGVLSDLGDEIRDARAIAASGGDITPRMDAIDALAAEAELRVGHPHDPHARLAALQSAVDEIEQTLIPLGMHVVDRGISASEAGATLRACADYPRPERRLPALTEALETALTEGAAITDLPPDDPERLAVEAALDAVVGAVLDDGPAPELPVPPSVRDGWIGFLTEMRDLLQDNDEVGALLHALDGGFVRPGPGGEPSRRMETLPTGRNLHALDPQRVPTPTAMLRGAAMAEKLLEEARARTGAYPETVAIVVWGIDNVKNGGETVAQILALLGVEPLPDAAGRVERFRLIPLAELGRPRIDVVATLSGIFRDIFPTTITLLDRAFRAVAAADEPDEWNHLRAHARAQSARLGLSLDQAATRLWSTPPGQYGTGVNHVVDASAWDERGDLAEVYLRRMGHAWGADALGERREDLLRASLATASVTFHSIDSAENSIGDVDHYYEYLGGLTAAVAHTAGREPDVLVADGYQARPKLRTLTETMNLEARTRLLNPRWYEAQLAHGYQGVHAVTVRLENTFGMQATTGAVEEWVFTAAAHTYLFDDDLRTRMQESNPLAVLRFANRLAEARDRGLWTPSTDDSQHLDELVEHLDAVAEGVA